MLLKSSIRVLPTESEINERLRYILINTICDVIIYMSINLLYYIYYMNDMNDMYDIYGRYDIDDGTGTVGILSFFLIMYDVCCIML